MNSWLRSEGVRAFFSRQGLLFIIAVALFAILWAANVRGPNVGFVPVLLYTLVVGNFITPIMIHLEPLYSRFRFPIDWIAFLVFLSLAAVACVLFTEAIVMVVYGIPFGTFFERVWNDGKFVFIVILIVGSVRHLYSDTRDRLERKNRELQRAVEMGDTRSKQQEQELTKAREIQEGLLPKRIPQVRGLEVAGTWQPASVVGGDYFDVLKLSENKIGVCIGDVVGKGISAALLMANLQASFRALVSDELSPGALMGKLNEVISNNIALDKFVTVCYATIDAAENILTYASAGHWPPILFRKSGEAIALKDGGAPLGVFSDRKYEDAELQLGSGDRLVLYTDGLTEAMNSEDQEFGERRLGELCRREIGLSAPDLLDAIQKDVVGFCSGNFRDDFTLVVVAVK
ncbi:MAG TPA: PP2C family protein-serine/threonine phosphatase [Candidatus Aquilonibacter sp.]|nr:PP2C family protein-serine/threonine phosphatase [Candidatus Aquilonibacter sp.]